MSQKIDIELTKELFTNKKDHNKENDELLIPFLHIKKEWETDEKNVEKRIEIGIKTTF